MEWHSAVLSSRRFASVFREGQYQCTAPAPCSDFTGPCLDEEVVEFGVEGKTDAQLLADMLSNLGTPIAGSFHESCQSLFVEVPQITYNGEVGRRCPNWSDDQSTMYSSGGSDYRLPVKACTDDMSNLAGEEGRAAFLGSCRGATEEYVNPNFTGASCKVDQLACAGSLPVDALQANGRTSLMIRNVPPNYTQDMLLEEWRYPGKFNFLYAPRTVRGSASLGYAFVNFLTPEDAVLFFAVWHKKRLKQHVGKALSILWADIQGFEANVLAVRKKRNRCIDARIAQPIVLCEGQFVPLIEHICLS